MANADKDFKPADVSVKDAKSEENEENSTKSSPTSDSQKSSVDRVKESADAGRESLRTRTAVGEPGQKQPAHKDTQLSNEEAVKEISSLQEKLSAPTKESSAKRAQQSGNLNPVAPENRTTGTDGDQQFAALNAAGGHLAAARTAIISQHESDARLLSDPRYERDQKVFEQTRSGNAGFIPPSEAEKAANQLISPEVAEAIPDTPEEQVAEDMERLEKAEETSSQIKGGVVASGVQENETKEETSKPLARTGSYDKVDGEETKPRTPTNEIK